MPDAVVTIEGGVPWDPRYSATQNGTSVGNLAVLAGRSRPLDGGGWEEITKTQYECTFWREHHDLLAALHPEKGSQVIVTGTVEGVDKFTTRDGNEFLSVKVNATGLKVKPPKEQRRQGGGAPQGGGYGQAQGAPQGGYGNAPQGGAPQGGGYDDPPF
ncbi:single-stranded DNA-binding protein [Brachybacterium sp.]|uniref:single-stranded DNA-binding protein n=1 Tax=Brachybacterium sp. TaxID=1891286 RepID=UPI002ED5E5BC